MFAAPPTTAPHQFHSSSYPFSFQPAPIACPPFFTPSHQYLYTTPSYQQQQNFAHPLPPSCPRPQLVHLPPFDGGSQAFAGATEFGGGKSKDWNEPLANRLGMFTGGVKRPLCRDEDEQEEEEERESGGCSKRTCCEREKERQRVDKAEKGVEQVEMELEEDNVRYQGEGGALLIVPERATMSDDALHGTMEGWRLCVEGCW